MLNNSSKYDGLVRKEVKRLSDGKSYPNNSEETNSATFETHNNENSDVSLTTKLQRWYLQYRPPTLCANALLQILNDEGLHVASSVIELTNIVDNGRSNQTVINKALDNSVQNSAVQSWNTEAGGSAHVIKTESFNTNSAIKDLQGNNRTGSTDVALDFILNCVKLNNIIHFSIEQQRQMNAKLNHMMQEIAKVNVRLNENVGIETDLQKNSNLFPIENVTALEDFENSVNETNTGKLILSIKRIVSNDHISKSLLRILSKDILLEHNLDGRQKKLALNAYPKLLNMIYRSYENYDSFSEFTWDLKHAMKRIKNRFHKANCISRKSILTPEADPLLINAKYAKKIKQDHDDDSFFS